jgi:ABC-2 type transport system ATP-binding protein
MRGRALERRAGDLLERFGLADAADRIARGYSGGMRRRLDIAMALVHDPRVLFLDEPTTGLDPEVRADMWEQIAALAAEQDKTVLLTTHYLEEADQLAARLAIVDRGKVVTEGTPEELKSELRGDAVYVDLVEIAADTGIHEVALDGRSLRARAEDGGRAVPSILQALEAHGIEVSTVRVARPSLDDVYLRYAGRTFQEAESEQDSHSKEAEVKR